VRRPEQVDARPQQRPVLHGGLAEPPFGRQARRNDLARLQHRLGAAFGVQLLGQLQGAPGGLGHAWQARDLPGIGRRHPGAQLDDLGHVGRALGECDRLLLRATASP